MDALGAPKINRSAICRIVSVISRLNRPAIASFSGTLLRRTTNSFSSHPKRLPVGFIWISVDDGLWFHFLPVFKTNFGH
jgi:hypothetical protein